MARTPSKRRVRGTKPPKKPLAWRITKIKLWRKDAKMTHQKVADGLVQIDADLDYDRVSIQRIETGNQRPPVIVLEAMVRLLKAPNLTAMLDRTPDEAREIAKIEAMEPKERRRLLRLMEAAKDAED